MFSSVALDSLVTFDFDRRLSKIENAHYNGPLPEIKCSAFHGPLHPLVVAGQPRVHYTLHDVKRADRLHRPSFLALVGNRTKEKTEKYLLSARQIGGPVVLDAAADTRVRDRIPNIEKKSGQFPRECPANRDKWSLGVNWIGSVVGSEEAAAISTWQRSYHAIQRLTVFGMYLEFCARRTGEIETMATRRGPIGSFPDLLGRSSKERTN